jgi:calcineurin-like phosphoesterase
MADGDVQMHGVIIDIDDETGKAKTIERIQKKNIE